MYVLLYCLKLQIIKLKWYYCEKYVKYEKNIETNSRFPYNRTQSHKFMEYGMDVTVFIQNNKRQIWRQWSSVCVFNIVKFSKMLHHGQTKGIEIWFVNGEWTVKAEGIDQLELQSQLILFINRKSESCDIFFDKRICTRSQTIDNLMKICNLMFRRMIDPKDWDFHLIEAKCHGIQVFRIITLNFNIWNSIRYATILKFTLKSTNRFPIPNLLHFVLASKKESEKCYSHERVSLMKLYLFLLIFPVKTWIFSGPFQESSENTFNSKKKFQKHKMYSKECLFKTSSMLKLRWITDIFFSIFMVYATWILLSDFLFSTFFLPNLEFNSNLQTILTN